MYRVRLNQFEGPLDLLLFFIQRDELDIYDIPIAEITDEFLSYVQVLEEIDLDSVGDFLYLAALLIQIKARMLMPTQEVDEEGEPIDPRAELVERLLQYVRFKEAAQKLDGHLAERADHFTRGAIADRDLIEPSPEIIADGSVFDLIFALRRILTREVDDTTHDIETEAYTIEEQQAYIRQVLLKVGTASFVELVQKRSKAFIITTFLAILEMAQRRRIRLVLTRGKDDFSIEALDLDAPTSADTSETVSGQEI